MIRKIKQFFAAVKVVMKYGSEASLKIREQQYKIEEVGSYLDMKYYPNRSEHELKKIMLHFMANELARHVNVITQVYDDGQVYKSGFLNVVTGKKNG